MIARTHVKDLLNMQRKYFSILTPWVKPDWCIFRDMYGFLVNLEPIDLYLILSANQSY